jgi:hypothetical protein
MFGTRSSVIGGWRIGVCSRGGIYAQDAQMGIEISTHGHKGWYTICSLKQCEFVSIVLEELRSIF